MNQKTTTKFKVVYYLSNTIEQIETFHIHHGHSLPTKTSDYVKVTPKPISEDVCSW